MECLAHTELWVSHLFMWKLGFLCDWGACVIVLVLLSLRRLVFTRSECGQVIFQSCLLCYFIIYLFFKPSLSSLTLESAVKPHCRVKSYLYLKVSISRISWSCIGHQEQMSIPQFIQPSFAFQRFFIITPIPPVTFHPTCCVSSFFSAAPPLCSLLITLLFTE